MGNSFTNKSINKVRQFILSAAFFFLVLTGFSQSGTIIINSTGYPVSSTTKFPIWLPGSATATINVGTNVSSISGILYNVTSDAGGAGGNILTLNSIVNITSSTNIAAGTSLKVEGVLFTSTSGSTPSSWNLVGNASGGSTLLGTTDNSPVSIQSGTGALGLGTDAAAKTITIGNSSVATNLVENTGGNFTLNGAGASNYSIGSSTTTGTISIGGATQTGTISIGPGSGSQTIGIGGASSTTAIGGNTTVAGTLGVTGNSALAGLTQTGTTNLNITGTAVTNIGNSSGGVYLPGFTTAGVVHNAVTTGKLSSGPVSLTSEASGVLPIANGGTNSSAIGTAGEVEYSNGSAHAFTASSGAANQVLHGSSAGTPSFSQVNLASGGDVTGVLPVANGGTGSSSASTLVSTHFAITSGVQIITSTTAQAVTGLSITFTPASSSSKFLIMAVINGSMAYVTSSLIYRNGSPILSQANNSITGANATTYTGATATNGDMYQQVINYLDAPATGSAVTYAVYLASSWSGSATSTYVNSRSGNDMTCPSTLTILEFAQ